MRRPITSGTTPPTAAAVYGTLGERNTAGYGGGTATTNGGGAYYYNNGGGATVTRPAGGAPPPPKAAGAASVGTTYLAASNGGAVPRMVYKSPLAAGSVGGGSTLMSPSSNGLRSTTSSGVHGSSTYNINSASGSPAGYAIGGSSKAADVSALNSPASSSSSHHYHPTTNGGAPLNGSSNISSGGSNYGNGPSKTYYYTNTPRSASQQPSASTSSLSSAANGGSGGTPPSGAAQQQRYRTTTTTLTTASPGGSGAATNGNGISARAPHRTSTMPAGEIRRNYDADPPPTYNVEHLASFAVGRQFHLQTPTDGIRKLKEMEKNSAIYAQPMILKLLPDRVVIEQSDGSLVESFALDLIVDPTAHQSTDPDELYNNVLLFVCMEDGKRDNQSTAPTEMHIFQCVGVSSQEVAEDLHHYIKGNYHKVRRTFARRTTTPHRGGSGDYFPPPPAPHRSPSRDHHQRQHNYRGEDAYASSADYFETDVNTLNRCFDDIEQFVARIQSTAIAQRELELQQQRFRHQQQQLIMNDRKSSKKQREAAAAAAAQQQQLQHERSILQLRAQLPTYSEFYELFQKFKLSLNLLAKLRDHIHEPNAPELLHFLFTPLMVTLDACHWGLNRNVAEQVVSPLLTVDACELLKVCLTPKEYDVWMSLGKAWRTPPEDWLGVLPSPYRPVFTSGYAPYGYPPPPQPIAATADIYGTAAPQPPAHYSSTARLNGDGGGRYSSAPPPIHRGVSAPPPLSHYSPAPTRQNYYSPAAHQPPPAPYIGRERSVDTLDIERINLEKERLEFERMKVLDREQQLLDAERRLREEEARLAEERRQLHREAEKHSIAGSDRPDFYRRGDPFRGNGHHSPPRSAVSSAMDRRMTGSVQVLSNGHVVNGGPPTRNASAVGGRGAMSPRGGGVVSASTYDVSSSSGGGGPMTRPAALPLSPPIAVPDQSPRQRAFFDELSQRRCKIVQVTYDRVAQNPKELTVARGEYLEVLNDAKNWWECRNVHSRLGYVPHTILSLVGVGGQQAPSSAARSSAAGSDNVSQTSSSSVNEPLAISTTDQPSAKANNNGDVASHYVPKPARPSAQISPADGELGTHRHNNTSQNGIDHHDHAGDEVTGTLGKPVTFHGSGIINDDATPDYIKKRQGKRGEFRYF